MTLEVPRGSAALGITQPDVLWTRAEVLGNPSAVPAVAGVYGWYFHELPTFLDVAGCVKRDDLTLLYVGIAPKAPPTNGRGPSSQTIRSRLRYHYRGNAEGSTLRLTLGCLLADRLGVDLRRVGSGKRMTFGGGEARLSEWMEINAYVAWVDTPQPWVVEHGLISTVDLPLNLDQNRHHQFHRKLSEIRSTAKARARTLPVLG
jgi:hypothetical protein